MISLDHPTLPPRKVISKVVTANTPESSVPPPLQQTHTCRQKFSNPHPPPPPSREKALHLFSPLIPMNIEITI